MQSRTGDNEGSELLFSNLSLRAGRKSTIITTNYSYPIFRLKGYYKKNLLFIAEMTEASLTIWH
jgi:hypothetical protein